MGRLFGGDIVNFVFQFHKRPGPLIRIRYLKLLVEFDLEGLELIKVIGDRCILLETACRLSQIVKSNEVIGDGRVSLSHCSSLTQMIKIEDEWHNQSID